MLSCEVVRPEAVGPGSGHYSPGPRRVRTRKQNLYAEPVNGKLLSWMLLEASRVPQVRFPDSRASPQPPPPKPPKRDLGPAFP